MPLPLLQLAREATNWTDPQLAGLLGIPPSSVQAIRVGRMPEKLTPAQTEALITELRGFLEDGAEVLAEIELRS